MTGASRRPHRTATALRRRSLAADRRGGDRGAARTGVRRMRWVLVVYALLVLVTFGKLVEIQVLNAPEYADRGVRQRARTVDLAATRGRIYDRDGQVLATSVQGATVYGDPRVFRPGVTPDGLTVPPAADPDAVAATLAPLLDRDPAVLAETLRREAHFVYLARQLDHEVGEAVGALGLPGIGVLVEPRRVYPGGGLAGQIVGFTGIDSEGLQGLEAQHDGILRGQPGMLVLERAPGGLDIASGMRELVPPEAGTDLVLTLDRDIQHAAERAALDAMERYDAVGASVVVLEVGTGDILGMASVPSFDPSDRSNVDPANLRNRAVTDVFEPGSTQKALTIAAAIEEGLVDEHTVLRVPDRIQVGGSRFSDSSAHGTEEWSVAEIMERSSNVGTIQVAQQLGPERLDAYLRAFGYGSRTGLGFPGESPGLLMPHTSWWGTSLPTIAIGQGVAVSLLQLGTSYATIANGGLATTPRIVRGTVGEDGRLTPAAAATERQVVSGATARQVQRMLEQVIVGDDGTGSLAAVPGYRVAGKTGTARKPSVDQRGYSGEYVATFVGLAPVEDPRIVVAVMVDEPTPYYGGIVAAPVFSEVMQAALIARQVPPDHGGESLPEAFSDARAASLAARAAARAGGDDDDPGGAG